MPHYKIQPSRCRRACIERDTERIGASKRQKLFEQTDVGIALVCDEAASGGDKASASCGFGRNWRRAVSTYAPRQLPKGGNLFLSPESDVKYAPSRGYIIIFLCPSILPYEKSPYGVRTSFHKVFLREQLMFPYSKIGQRKIIIKKRYRTALGVGRFRREAL